MSIFEFNSSLPLINRSTNSLNYLTPKASIRFNPGDMKDYNSNDRSINVDGIFDINRPIYIKYTIYIYRSVV